MPKRTADPCPALHTHPVIAIPRGPTHGVSRTASARDGRRRLQPYDLRAPLGRDLVGGIAISSLPVMLSVKRVLGLLVVAALVILLLAVPATATQGEQSPTSTQTSAPEGAEGSPRMKLPLDLEDPQDLVGLGILIATGIGAALAGANMVKQLRGERPQATGRRRPR